MIMIYDICGENRKTRSNRKSDFRNKLQLMSPLKPTNIPPTYIKVCVVDAKRVLRLIPITAIQPSTFMKWAEAVKYIYKSYQETHYMLYLMIIHLAM